MAPSAANVSTSIIESVLKKIPTRWVRGTLPYIVLSNKSVPKVDKWREYQRGRAGGLWY